MLKSTVFILKYQKWYKMIVQNIDFSAYLIEDTACLGSIPGSDSNRVGEFTY